MLCFESAEIRLHSANGFFCLDLKKKRKKIDSSNLDFLSVILLSVKAVKATTVERKKAFTERKEGLGKGRI